MKKILIYIIALIILLSAVTTGYFIHKAKKEAELEGKYEQAIASYNQKKYETALFLFSELKEYKHAAEYLTQIKTLPIKETRNTTAYRNGSIQRNTISESYYQYNEWGKFDFYSNVYSFENYIYDQNGNCLKIITTSHDTGKISNKEYVYNSLNQCILETFTDQGGATESTERIYDINGNCTKTIFIPRAGDRVETEFFYNEEGQIIRSQKLDELQNPYNIREYSYIFDNRGNPIEKTVLTNGEKEISTYKYDDRNNLIEETVQHHGEVDKKTYKYDDKNNLIEEAHMLNGEELRHSIYQYDSAGRIIQEESTYKDLSFSVTHTYEFITQEEMSSIPQNDVFIIDDTSKGYTNNTITERSSSSARHTDSEAWSCAKDIVKQNLKAPSSAVFCSFTEAKVIHIGNGKYEVSGWVEAQNSFGAKLRQSFVVSYTATANGYKDGYCKIG